MTSVHSPDITRRSALGTMVGLVVTGSALAEQKPAADPVSRRWKMSEVESEFLRLRPLFEDERKQFTDSSDTHAYWKGPHGKAIIALGPAIIPQLIQELRKGDFFFNVPLAAITNVDIATENSASEQDNSKLWLKWWEGGKERG
jgi:hypothetical protein